MPQASSCGCCAYVSGSAPRRSWRHLRLPGGRGSALVSTALVALASAKSCRPRQLQSHLPEDPIASVPSWPNTLAYYGVESQDGTDNHTRPLLLWTTHLAESAPGCKPRVPLLDPRTGSRPILSWDTRQELSPLSLSRKAPKRVARGESDGRPRAPIVACCRRRLWVTSLVSGAIRPRPLSCTSWSSVSRATV